MKRQIFALLIFFNFSFAQGQFKYENNIKKLDAKLVSETIANEQPGYSLIIIKNDSLIYTKNEGVKDLKTNSKIDEHTPCYDNIINYRRKKSILS